MQLAPDADEAAAIAAAIQRFQVLFFWRVMPFLWFAAALSLWRSFVRAEATEGRGREIHFPHWLGARRDGQRVLGGEQSE